MSGMEIFEDARMVSRAELAAWLRQLADQLDGGHAFYGAGGMVAVADQVHCELEIERDGSELSVEIEFSWTSVDAGSAAAGDAGSDAEEDDEDADDEAESAADEDEGDEDDEEQEGEGDKGVGAESEKTEGHPAPPQSAPGPENGGAPQSPSDPGSTDAGHGTTFRGVASAQ